MPRRSAATRSRAGAATSRTTRSTASSRRRRSGPTSRSEPMRKPADVKAPPPRVKRVPASRGRTLRAVAPARKQPARGRKTSGALERLDGWLAAHRIAKAKIGGFDVDGVWRGKYISLEKLRSAAKGGLGFCDVVFGWDLEDAL